MWFHLDRLHVPFFNFGLDTYILPREAAPAFAPQAERNVTNRPAPKGLIANTSEKYPSYNTSIPDQFRADVFMEEFQEKWGAGKMPMPAYTTIRLGNDHGAGVRVNEGYPYFQSYMSDNDLALGRIIEFLTHTPYWKNMLIVVTEDDAQGGVDHVDAHRSVLLAVSPYVRRGHVSHEHLSFGSIMKTFWNCLNVPYLNQYDAGAQDMADFFTNTPDFTPYKALPVDPEIFDPSRALDPYDREFNWASLKESPEMDNMGVMQDQSHAADQERAGYQPLIPEIIAAGSHFVGKTTVTLKARIYNSAIRYTLDGSEPTWPRRSIPSRWSCRKPLPSKPKPSTPTGCPAGRFPPYLPGKNRSRP
ncbi:MAG: chitobiase/beta-hexosaminidase C-terminal domain-containing protein [Haliscomenobacter sp.]|nr:chitobiase/beta-hexosaminidase C-terminal domain-containing protein [Haliscomenobacter sp.]